MTRNQQIMLAAALIILLGGGGYYFATRPADQAANSTEQEEASATSTGESSGNNGPLATTTTKPNYSIKVEALSAPTLDRPITIRTTLTATQKTQAEAKIKELVSKLKADPNQHPLWIDLGSYWRTIGDYDAARQVWEYVTQVWPTDSVAYSNLGTLYKENIKDPAKAESYFLAAINKDSSYGYGYVQLAEFYHDVAKNDAKAREILQKGITASPANAQMLQSLIEAYGG